MRLWLCAVQIAVTLCCSKEIVWVSGGSTQVDRGSYTTPAIQTSYQQNFIPGAVFVWESNSNSLGTCSFLQTFAVPIWLLSRITKVTLWIVVDDYYTVTLNGKPIGSGPYFVVGTIDISTSWLVGADSTTYRENRLVMDVGNTGGFGGLQYKLSILSA